MSEEKNISASKVRKPLGKRLASVLFASTPAEVKDYLLTEVVEPAAKDLLSDVVSMGIDKLIYGSASRGKSSNKGGNVVRSSLGTAYVDYSSSSKKPSATARDRAAGVSIYNDDIVFETYAEAEDTRQMLITILEEYQAVQIGKLYDHLKWPTQPMDFKYGWRNLSSAKVTRDRRGWVLVLPKVEYLD